MTINFGKNHFLQAKLVENILVYIPCKQTTKNEKKSGDSVQMSYYMSDTVPYHGSFTSAREI